MFRTMLPFLLILTGVILAVAVLKLDKGRRTPARPTPSRPAGIDKEKVNLRQYLMSLYDLYGVTKDEEIKILLHEIIANLNQIEQIMTEDPSVTNTVENFADKYLPIVIESVAKFNKIPDRAKDTHRTVKKNLSKTLDMFNNATVQMINRYAEAQSQGIMVDNDALQSLLVMNGDIKKEAMKIQ